MLSQISTLIQLIPLLPPNKISVEVPPLGLAKYLTRQRRTNNWCWAHVTAVIAKHYDNSSVWAPEVLAERLLGKASCRDGQFDQGCDAVCLTKNALRFTRNWRRTVAVGEGHDSFDLIYTELQNRRPVCVRIEWRDGPSGNGPVGEGVLGAHAFIIDGIRRDVRGNVEYNVVDPNYDGGMHTPIELEAYGSGGGLASRWVQTHLTKAVTEAEDVGATLLPQEIGAFPCH